jgi:glycosyltransferase involved in cell wall biosynthesis
MPAPRFSIIIPARNEGRYLSACLESIRVAAMPFETQVEVIVVLNCCTDETEEIARAWGARVVQETARNLAAIRNSGARLAVGQVLVTIDADSRMSPTTLTAIDRAVASKGTVGGGTAIRPDRYSPGILTTLVLLRAALWMFGLSGGLFWCRVEDFDAVGGFNENLVSGEDVDFARRLKAYGRIVRRPFSTLCGAYIVTSCRKFDRYGDWCVLRHPLLFWRLFRGTSRPAADAFYYDFPR